MVISVAMLKRGTMTKVTRLTAPATGPVGAAVGGPPRMRFFAIPET
jgi:hypothetical protein